MDERIVLEYEATEAVPSAVEIAEVARSTQFLLLRWGTMYEILDDGYMSRDTGKDFQNQLIDQLTPILPDYTVFDSGGGMDERFRPKRNWFNRRRIVGKLIPGNARISILRVIAEEEIMANADAIVAAARAFRHQATDLMIQLAANFDVPLQAFANRLFYVEYDVPGNGLLIAPDGEWEYYFHGRECCFSHGATGQILEVILRYPNEFGVLDPYFFAIYLRTTARFELLSHLFRDKFHDPLRALDVLEARGLLTVIHDDHGRCGRFAPGDADTLSVPFT